MRSIASKAVAVLLLAAGTLIAGQHQAHASTSQFRGVNWADQRDNFVNGVLYVSGLSSSDTYASAATVADRVVGQMYAITGANTVRMPINEPTVADYWGTYTGAIDTALAKGRVILAYWAYSGGKPASTTAFYQMWDKVVAKYGGNPNAYFEVINEPYAYTAASLDNTYNDWLTRYSAIPRDRVILDGTGDAQNVAAVGSDHRLDNTLLAVHDYSFFAGYEDETEWANHIAGYIGGYADRTVATEWGAPMGPGSKNGVHYDSVDYSIPSGSFFADYVRGVSSELRRLGMGSVYWPGLRDGDWYSLTTRTGTGANTTLSLVNPTGLTRLRYAWGIGSGGGTYVRIVNATTGLYVDGASGADADEQNGDASRYQQQWTVENDGNYVRIKNRATGLYLDGEGRTSDGAAVGQSADTNATSQQWTVLTDANNVRIKNRATGKFIDGMGRTASGSALGQWSDSSSANQQWRIVAAG
ncbi:RICIN domain-containing protein [Kutzneria buriramensis]|uniref:Ricin-type beta-trefoil lectin protein n=1 Tax=Kutzneria buriramensis TaxID=1045776 RepID=A0A3E0GU39_9PSEU|nr:RICIN domain-containing protein [Kutzneria buriramensis]REH27770.1 ricin-type beta-trefoil lectin protein [Kutzneria buriramensis]